MFKNLLPTSNYAEITLKKKKKSFKIYFKLNKSINKFNWFILFLKNDVISVKLGVIFMIVMVWDKFLTKINFQECKNIIAFITIQAPAISFFFLLRNLLTNHKSIFWSESLKTLPVIFTLQEFQWTIWFKKKILITF